MSDVIINLLLALNANFVVDEANSSTNNVQILLRLKFNRTKILKAPALTTRRSLRLRLHNGYHVTILGPFTFTAQCTAAIDHNLLAAMVILPTPEDGILSRDCLPRALNPDLIHT